MGDSGLFYIEQLVQKQDEESMGQLVYFTKVNGLSDEEIKILACRLAASGKSVNLNRNFDLYDIPSTGGPSSLSTLITPLILRTLKKNVLKLAVPGRPAGAIDVLYQIPNYEIAPPVDELENLLAECGYVHFVTNENYCPLDGAFFNFRKMNDALNIPSLVIASILSKKIAVGVKNVGLDIRVSEFGNFGSEWNAAKRKAKRFIDVATLLGIKSKCFLSRGDIPQQPYIGRGESLLAISRITENNFDGLLKKHFFSCLGMCLSLTNSLNYEIDYTEIKKAFFDNLLAQGGTISAYSEKLEQVERAHRYKILAKKSGFLKVSLLKIRRLITEIQQGNKDSLYPDTCGVILQKDYDEYVTKNDVICTFRCDGNKLKEFERDLELCFEYTQIKNNTSEIEIVT